jgi:hypothetical protein
MRQIKLGAYTNALLIKALLEGDYNCMDLAELTGLHYTTVSEYLRELCRVGGAHISAWEKDSRGRDVIKVYRLGAGKDAKREKLTGAERQARVRAKRDAERMQQVLAGKARYVQAANGRLRFEVVA